MIVIVNYCNAADIFLLEPKGRERGGEELRSLGFFYCLTSLPHHTLTLRCSPYQKFKDDLSLGPLFIYP